MLNVQATSCAVTGVPSLNRASGRSTKATERWSAATSTDSARWQYPVDASSASGASRESNSRVTPSAAVPRTTKGLKLSKVPMADSTSSPPFGASGLTWGKNLKSAGNFGGASNDSA